MDALLRILIVINRLTARGGAEGSTALIIDGLQGDGLEFAAVTLLDLDLTDRDALERRGVVFFESAPGFLRQVATTVRAVKSFQPDLIHATLFDSELVACIAGIVCGVPVLRSAVNTPYAPRSSDGREVSCPSPPSALSGSRPRPLRDVSLPCDFRRDDGVGGPLARTDPSHVFVVLAGRAPSALGENTPARRQDARKRLGMAPTRWCC